MAVDRVVASMVGSQSERGVEVLSHRSKVTYCWRLGAIAPGGDRQRSQSGEHRLDVRRDNLALDVSIAG